MSPPPLALEIHYQIMGHITQHTDLSALSLCCRSFRDEAQRKLFRDPGNTDLTFVRQGKFFEVIIASPGRLAPMVKSYNLKTFVMDGPRAEQRRNAAAAALRLMCNLTTLSIDDRQSRCIYMTALLDCPFELHTLAVVRTGGRYTPNVDLLLFDFLRKQPSLRILTISGEKADPVITQSLRDDPTWCPNLVSLTVEASLMDIFLAKHRPIQHLDWYGPTSKELGQSSHLSSLKYLSCSSYLMANVSFLQTFQRMTSLILLDVYIHDADGEALVEQLYLHKNIPQLRYLILSGLVDIFATREPGPEDVRAAFELCPTLVYIDMSMATSVYDDLDTFDRFYPPDARGEMAKIVLRKDDVYAWKKAF
ncbi:hypothetical protein D9619_009485 [Psilocybe cf. subviscida]|uniref:F-box domain-containing protein n=1 Tax=Psilocybe cf. subviscida TaxID=2480587 RepID=A0A8H5BUZ7_9AGAR|nr:hypothetical protein D9619_009485 [Psilocybe cf. subviscida]